MTARELNRKSFTRAGMCLLIALRCSGADGAEPYGSTYEAGPYPPVVIRDATIVTASGPTIEHGSILISGGKIVAVGANVNAPTDAKVIEAHGRWLTPGVIDPHSHSGGLDLDVDNVNEMSDPNTAGIRVEDSIWVGSPDFDALRRNGVTTLQILPGSANEFGGQTVIIKNVRSTTIAGMKFPGASPALKMACGTNPISVYGAKGRAPFTGAGEMAGYREAFNAAREYAVKWDSYEADRRAGKPAVVPARDLRMETLRQVLAGTMRVHIHCYRSDDMARMITLSHEFNFHITAFHHALEAFKIAHLIVSENIGVITWADWGGYKPEAYDAIPENAAFITAAGGVAAMHSDDVLVGQHLNVDAGRAFTAGRQAGLPVTHDDAIRWFTLNPAKLLGIADKVGSIEPGKMADVVLWSADPLSVYALADQVYIDGALVFDRGAPSAMQTSDFLLGQPDVEGTP